MINMLWVKHYTFSKQGNKLGETHEKKLRDLSLKKKYIYICKKSHTHTI